MKNHGRETERRNVKCLWSDNRGEYTSAKFKAYLVGGSIVHQLSILRQVDQNGVAERMNQTLIERASSMR